MSPKKKSRKPGSKREREDWRSKTPLRRSTSPRETASGLDEKGCGKSGNDKSKRQEQEAQGKPDSSDQKKPRRRLKKRVPIGEALRKQGLDEHTIAGTYAQVLDNLKGTKKAGSNEKLLVEILKECSRQIEAAQPVGEKSVQVQLVHNVERPARTNPADTTAPQESK